jgi:hypothetical protein
MNGNDINNRVLRFNSGWDTLGTDRMTINGGNGNVNMNSELFVVGNTNLRNTVIYSGNESSGIGLYFSTPFTCNPFGTSKSVIICEPITNHSRHHLTFCMNRDNNNGINVGTNDVYIRLHQDNYIQFFEECRWSVWTWHKCTNGNDRMYFEGGGTTYIKAGPSANQIFFRNSTDTNIGYFQNNLFYGYLINLSDRRIKWDIQEINDETTLNMILQIQPTTYYYRDETRNEGNGKVYGFITQQIKEVIPDAVSTTQEIIVNIYKTCLIYNKSEIYHNIPQDVTIDTEVQILDREWSDKGKRYKIKEIYDDYFVIDEDIEGDDCFVFGYNMNYLHGLDKNYIYTLNVCATHELHRRLEAQDKRIKELETKLEKLINYIYQ